MPAGRVNGRRYAGSEFESDPMCSVTGGRCPCQYTLDTRENVDDEIQTTLSTLTWRAGEAHVDSMSGMATEISARPPTAATVTTPAAERSTQAHIAWMKPMVMVARMLQPPA